MSAYLPYIFRRAGMPPPTRVKVLQHPMEWANNQVSEEFRVQYPDSQVETFSSLPTEPGSLYVLPYSGEYIHQVEKHLPLAVQLSNVSNAWIMLYGLDMRAFVVLPARAWPGYLRRERLLYGLLQFKERIKGLLGRGGV